MRWLSLCMLLSGCSFLFAQGPPDNHETIPYFDCISSEAPPVVDTLEAVTAGLSAIAIADDEGSSNAGVVVAGAFAVTFTTSAIYGFYKASTCDAAKLKLRNRIFVRNAARERELQELRPELEAQPMGCKRDDQCKGDRVCEGERCVYPPTPPDPAPPADNAAEPDGGTGDAPPRSEPVQAPNADKSGSPASEDNAGPSAVE